MSRVITARSALPLVALGVLALGGCNRSDNAQSADNTIEVNGSAPTIQNESADEGEDVSVAQVPAPATGTATNDAAPLQQAQAVAQEIATGTDVTRVHHGDGWAWMRNGQIIRTASNDGKDVAYFRPGETRPFFAQKGSDAYAYSGGRAVRKFDRDGRAKPADANDGRDAASDAERRLSEARTAAEQAGDRKAAREAVHKGGATAAVLASPTPPPLQVRPERGGRGNDNRGGAIDNADQHQSGNRSSDDHRDDRR